jgi:2'-5' RNA ligase
MDDPALVSAVIICAPPPVAEFVRSLRGESKPDGAQGVPPHITVMYPFVSPGTVAGGQDPELVKEAIERLRAICRTIAPFSVTLDRYGTFPGRVLYLAPSDPGPIVALYERLLAHFPAYPLYGGEFTEIVPHLTVVVVESQAALDDLPRPPFDPMTFEVRQLHYVVGDPELARPWSLAGVIPLEG